MANKNQGKKGIIYQIIASAAFVGAVIFIGSLFPLGTDIKAGEGNFIYPEIKEIQDKQITSFVELTKYFTELANKKGGEYAFKVLLIAPIPPNTDMHLLGHTVGDVLYKQKGLEGIKVCTQDFRNACSHSIVVGLLLEKGESQEVLSQITDACKQAPGGPGAYTMCFHGLGHGVLAYAGYDMPAAIKICEKTGTLEYGDREAIECIGGTVMETISGGFHNPELWAEQSKKYLPESDPLYPCNSDFMPENARQQCYIYITPNLFNVASGNIHPSNTPENFEKAFKFCGRIPENETWNRNACYGGFGKEFVVLGKDRDVRNIDKMSDEELVKVINWCGLADNKDGIRSCLNNAGGSIYWGGENDRHAVIRFCGLIQDGSMQDGCYMDIIGSVGFYITDQEYRREFCSELPAKHAENCRQNLIFQP